MIEILNNFPENAIALSREGQVTKEDYDGILVPAILEALKRHDKIRLLYRLLQISPATTQALSGRTSRSVWSTPHDGSASRRSQTWTGSYKW
jgi:hypothetical protein